MATSTAAGPSGMRRAMDVLDRIERGLIAVLAGVALVVAAAQMLGRYLVPSLAPDWTGEVQIYLMVWAILLAAGLLVRENGHINADLLLAMLPARVLSGFRLFNLAVSLAVSLFLLGYGVEVVSQAIQWRDRSMSTLRFPLWIYFAALPVASGLMVVSCIWAMIQLRRRQRETGEPGCGGQ